MKKFCCSLVLVLLAPFSPLSAQTQDTGGLPQAVQWGMQQAMRDLETQSLGITEETMAEEVGAEALEEFIAGAVVRLVLSPTGSFAAYTLEGGDVTYYVGPLNGLFCMGLADEDVG